MNFKTALTSEELETVLTPHLRLFMSVDVVGSTAFKHNKTYGGEEKPWLKFIHGFYTGFPPDLLTAKLTDTLSESEVHQDIPMPYLWKALGDELVFCVLLRHPSYAKYYIKAFRSALIEACTKWVVEPPRLPINFKGAAWLAGFPIHNTAVPLDTKERLSLDSEHFDFVGPLIDIGFRLSHMASPRKLVISADTAWLLTAANDGAGGLNFFYEGRHSLKGVLNDRPYPIFWIDCLDLEDPRNELSRTEDVLLNRKAASKEDVEKLAKTFLQSVEPSIPFPFFYGHGSVPEKFRARIDIEQQLDRARQDIRRIYTSEQPNRPEGEAMTPPDQSQSEIDQFIRQVDESL